MGEYYDWVNVDRREYICPSDFGMGNKLFESSSPHTSFLCALRELLANEWKGSHIIFLGDSMELTRNVDNETLSRLYQHSVESGYEGIGIDTVVETYSNISGMFSASEKEVRHEVELYLKELEIGEADAFNEYSVDPDDPFKGLFVRKGQDFRYTINYTKKVYYSPDEIRMIQEEPDDIRIDPISYLMRHGYDGVGDWVGDIIGVSDEIPEGFTLITELTIEY